MTFPHSPTLGLLHTSPVHVATFDALVAADAPGTTVRHLVRGDLLDRARTDGPETVADEVESALEGLDADVVLCTCSTLGPLVERVGGHRVLRVDRAMAAQAVALAGVGGRVVALVAVESTIGPTRDLLLEEAARAGVAPTVEVLLVEGAWARFEAGDDAAYHRLIAAAISDVGARADHGADHRADHRTEVVVLAQASMAPAAVGAIEAGAVPVLTSPALGVRAALQALEAGQRGP